MPETQVEETPDTHPDRFEAVRRRRARRHVQTSELWEKDRLHGDYWEVYKDLKRYEQGVRDRAVWSDGRLKEKFQ
jgi:hypothetical protein